MIDPSKLITGANTVYGEAVVRERFGNVVAAPAERVVTVADEEVIELAGRPLRFFDTPGHATHHHCIFDIHSRSLFTGDTFGLCYRELTGERPFLFPTTSPARFDPTAMHASIDRMMVLEPSWLFLTHFGGLREAPVHAANLHRLIDALCELGRSTPEAQLGDAIMSCLLAELDDTVPLSEAQRREVLAMDVELNRQGLRVWLSHQQ